jgi:hypothetical protein
MKVASLVLLLCFAGMAALPLVGEIDLMAMKKQEEERRKKLAKSKIAVTDSNVNSVVTGGKKFAFVQMEIDAPADEAPAAAAPESKGTEDPTQKPEYWQKQQSELEERIAGLKTDIESAQLELNRLWSEFYMKSVAAEQAAIRDQISQKTNEMEQKKVFLRESEVELENLLEKARKAGVPPGWLR